MSMKDFITNTLPQIRHSSPEPLDRGVELRLEQEIENEKSTVVSGDGIGTTMGLEAINDEFGTEETSGGHDETIASSKDYNSWGRSPRLWPLFTLSSLDEEDGYAYDAWHPTATPPPSPIFLATKVSDALEEIPTLRRIRSAVSLYVPSSAPALHQTNRQAGSSQVNRRRPSPGPIRLPPITMSKVKSPPPSPSLRRSSTSHPDIASLVENWSLSGPANQTMHYGTTSKLP